MDDLLIIRLLSATVIIPTVIGILYFNRLAKAGRYLLLFFIVNLLTEIITVVVANVWGNNIFVYYFYVTAVAFALSSAYSIILGKELRYFFSIVPIIAAIEWLIYGSSSFNSLSLTALNLLVIYICLISFYQMVNLQIGRPLYYFTGTLLFYSLSSTLFVFTARYMQNSDMVLMLSFFNIHSVINALTNLAFGFALWTSLKLSTSVQ